MSDDELAAEVNGLDAAGVVQAALETQHDWAAWLLRFGSVTEQARSLWADYRELHARAALLAQRGSKLGVAVNVRMACDSEESRRAHDGRGLLLWRPGANV